MGRAKRKKIAGKDFLCGFAVIVESQADQDALAVYLGDPAFNCAFDVPYIVAVQSAPVSGMTMLQTHYAVPEWYALEERDLVEQNYIIVKLA